MPFTNKAYIGVAKVHARLFGSTGAFRPIGNVDGLNLQHELDIKQQRDFQRLGGGTLFKLERIQSVNSQQNWLDFNAENFALAVTGDATEVVGATITDEVIKGYVDATMPLAHPPSAITTVMNAAETVTYEAGDDYEMSASGLYFPPGSSVVDGADLHVTYTHGAYTNIEAATRTSTILEMLYEGLNEADSGKAVIVNLWKVSMPSAAEIALISEDFGAFQFPAELLKDTTKGVGESAFYRVRMVA